MLIRYFHCENVCKLFYMHFIYKCSYIYFTYVFISIQNWMQLKFKYNQLKQIWFITVKTITMTDYFVPNCLHFTDMSTVTICLYKNLNYRPEAATIHFGQRPKHLRILREAIRRHSLLCPWEIPETWQYGHSRYEL